MDKKIILVIATIISCFYCFRFGYILTGYGHGGQLLGIPFTIIILILTIFYFNTTQSQLNKKIFSLVSIYFTTLSFFSVIVEAILKSSPNSFEILHVESKGNVGKIFIGCLTLGLISTIMAFKKINREQLKSL
jgi:hypothetical protein